MTKTAAIKHCHFLADDPTNPKPWGTFSPGVLLEKSLSSDSPSSCMGALRCFHIWAAAENQTNQIKPHMPELELLLRHHKCQSLRRGWRSAYTLLGDLHVCKKVRTSVPHTNHDIHTYQPQNPNQPSRRTKEGRGGRHGRGCAAVVERWWSAKQNAGVFQAHQARMRLTNQRPSKAMERNILPQSAKCS